MVRKIACVQGSTGLAKVTYVTRHAGPGAERHPNPRDRPATYSEVVYFDPDRLLSVARLELAAVPGDCCLVDCSHPAASYRPVGDLEAELVFGPADDMADRPHLLYLRRFVNFAAAGLGLETFGLWMVDFAAGPLNLGCGKMQMMWPGPIESGWSQIVQGGFEAVKGDRMTAEKAVCCCAVPDGGDGAGPAVLERRADDLKRM